MNSLQTRSRNALQQTFCDTGVLERPRYFPRQLITPDELILEQNYFRDKLRRHNRLLHGWGVVCGAVVCRVASGRAHDTNGRASDWPCPEPSDQSSLDPWNVSVSSGYILGPYGDEIVINCDRTIDVRTACVTGVSSEICPPAPDPWCNDVQVERGAGAVYLAVRYKEIQTRPVRVQPYGCGCDDAACENSRIRDGFELCTLNACPPSHQGEPPREIACELQLCPPCPDDPWVVLARIDIDANGIRAVDNYSCRRMVLALHSMWCRPESPEHDKPRDDQQAKALEERAREAVIVNLDVQREDVADAAVLRQVMERNATELRSVTSESTIGKKLVAEKISIAKIAAMKREDFVAFATEGADNANRRRQAREVWERAQTVKLALDAWERGHE